MSALPVYHSVPTDEKRPISPTVEIGEFDPRYVHPAAVGFEGLHVGTPRNAFQVAKDKYTGLSKVKKALVALAVVWFALVISHQAARLTGGKHHHAHHHASTEFDVKQWRDHSFHRFGHPAFLEDAPPGCNGDREDRAPEELSSVATVYQSIRVVESNDATKILSANASFPLKLGRGKHFDLNFQGEGNVVISRAAEESDDSTVNVLVESTWSNEEAEGVEMMSGEHSHALSVVSSESSSHIVHLVLPANKKRLPSISIASTKDLKLEIHPSVQDIHVGKLSVKSESGDIKLPTLAVNKLEAETVTGSVGGNFNVSKAFVIKTVTGNINATVHVVPLFPPHHKPNSSSPYPREREHDFHHFDDAHKHKSPRSHHGEHMREKKHSRRRFHSEEKKSSWWSLDIFKSKKEKKPHHPPPPPVFIGAFSTSGNILLKVFGPPFISAETKAFSHTGDVEVVQGKTFHGFYEVGTFKGSYDVIIREDKVHKVLEQFITEEGGKQKGLVFNPKHNKTEDSPEKRHFRDADSFEGEFPPPPPGKGPDGPGGPPPGPPGPPSQGSWWPWWSWWSWWSGWSGWSGRSPPPPRSSSPPRPSPLPRSSSPRSL
ncbi:hypothetical protein D1P53_002570 [Cryptococcus gattii VGV]|nr:hypothetical protein D1P53_002570 [Cryptococcus gattii VGV]